MDAALGLGGGAAALELVAWAAHYRRDDAATGAGRRGRPLGDRDGQKVGCLIIGGWARQCAGDLAGAECASRRPTGWPAASGAR